MPQQKIRVLLVDDHPMMLKGLAAALEPEPDIEVVGTAKMGASAISLYRDLKPDVAIVDILLGPEMTGIDATAEIRREFPDARIVMISARKGEGEIGFSVEAGARGYLLKEDLSDDLALVIRKVYAGARHFSPEVAARLADHFAQERMTGRELAVLRLMALGYRNKEIAKALMIAVSTVQEYVKKILSKLKVHDRTAAVTVALRKGLIHLD